MLAIWAGVKVALVVPEGRWLSAVLSCVVLVRSSRPSLGLPVPTFVHSVPSSSELGAAGAYAQVSVRGCPSTCIFADIARPVRCAGRKVDFWILEIASSRDSPGFFSIDEWGIMMAVPPQATDWLGLRGAYAMRMRSWCPRAIFSWAFESVCFKLCSWMNRAVMGWRWCSDAIALQH